MNTAKFVTEITVIDPDSGLPVEIDVFKHEGSGGMFAVDASYLDQCFDDDTDPVINDVFSTVTKKTTIGLVTLTGI